MPEAPQQMRLTINAFLNGAGTVVDVRSPGEFRQGHRPGAHNLPLFTDEQRAQVGTTYKREGRQAAVLKGLALVGPRLEAMGQELVRLAGLTPQEPLRLHCWRGGMRSESVAWLAQGLGLNVVVLKGGYKAYRHWVQALIGQPWPIRLLGGRTGSGKTDLLLSLQRRGVAVIDLEGLANHRGSSFGGLGLGEQPSSEHYENLLAEALSPLEGAEAIWLEDESAQVGRCRIPAGLWRQMKRAPLLEVRRPLDTRLDHLVATYGNQGQAPLAAATERIAKRLGPQRTALALEAIAAGNYRCACRQILDYYDRCYDHGLQVRSSQLGRGAVGGAAGGAPARAPQGSPDPGAHEPPVFSPAALDAASSQSGAGSGRPPSPDAAQPGGRGPGGAGVSAVEIGCLSAEAAADQLLAAGLIGGTQPRRSPD